MKRIMAALLMIIVLAVNAGCGDTKTVNGVTYDTYGLINEGDKHNPYIQYEPIWGNIVWGIILVETIIAPIYFFGFSMFEPVGAKSTIKGAVPN